LPAAFGRILAQFVEVHLAALIGDADARVAATIMAGVPHPCTSQQKSPLSEVICVEKLLKSDKDALQTRPMLPVLQHIRSLGRRAWITIARAQSKGRGHSRSVQLRLVARTKNAGVRSYRQPRSYSGTTQ
jgi:hypothetical protein